MEDRKTLMSYAEKNGLRLYDEALYGKNDQCKETLKRKEEEGVKVVPSLREAIVRSGLKDGMTISFHHHFRGGDYIVNMVLDEIAALGIRNIRIEPSSLSNIHTPLIDHIKNGVVTGIGTSGLRGDLAKAVSHGLMDTPVTFRSHGGRASAIKRGDIHIDVAFLGVSSCDPMGNANGYTREGEGKTMCGSLGYARIDAQYADHVVIITENMVPYPNAPFGISQRYVDQIVLVDSVGDPAKIMSGATRFTKKPQDLLIAEATADVIAASPYFYDGFSIQTGSGGASLAVIRFLREYMIDRNIHAGFALGGITGAMVKLHEEGLIKKILDVQSFDLDAARSLKNNHLHQQIDANFYASPDNEMAAVNMLDVVVLSALEVDTSFNVNVLVGSDGVIMGAVGGHPDTAAGAALSIVVCPLIRGRIPCVVDKVNTCITPGWSVDVVVTDQGIAVNPERPEIEECLVKAGLNVTTLEALKAKAERMTGVPEPLRFGDKIVGVVEYRDGSVIDLIHNIEDGDIQ